VNSRYLGTRDEVSEAIRDSLAVVEPFERLKFMRPDGVPVRFPHVPDGKRLVCGLLDVRGPEHLSVAYDLQDMLALDHTYGSGNALKITWYFGEVPDA
jgi:hypothetical protein